MDLPLDNVCFLVRKAAPRVGSLQSLNFSQVKRVRMEVLPTPESPTAISFIWLIYSPFSSDIIDLQSSNRAYPQIPSRPYPLIIIIILFYLNIFPDQNAYRSIGDIYIMEFGFASDRTNNAFFDRVIQMGVEISISQVTYCLESCRIAHRAHLEPRLSFPQKACLQDCARNMSFNTSLEEEN